MLTNTMRNSSVRAATFSSIYMPIVTSLGSIVTGLALWKGGYDTLSGAISLGTLVIFINYTVSFIEPVRSIANIFSEMQSAQAAAERVVSLVETEPDIVDGPEITAVYGDQFSPKRENWPKIHGDVDFEHVSFQYKGGEKVLSDFTLHVKAGQNIALVGETGSGKSTIVNLICRFYEPTEGSILPGITRKSILQLAQEKGIPVEERPIAVEELFQAHAEGRLTEAFGTGTAAVISPVGELAYRDRSMILNEGKIGPVSQAMYDNLVGIQRGDLPDPHGWVYPIG